MFRATCHVNAKASSVNASSNGSCCIFVYQARVPTVAMKCVRQARKRRVKVCIRTTASTNVEMMEFVHVQGLLLLAKHVWVASNTGSLRDME